MTQIKQVSIQVSTEKETLESLIAISFICQFFFAFSYFFIHNFNGKILFIPFNNKNELKKIRIINNKIWLKTTVEEKMFPRFCSLRNPSMDWWWYLELRHAKKDNSGVRLRYAFVFKILFGDFGFILDTTWVHSWVINNIKIYFGWRLKLIFGRFVGSTRLAALNQQ